jgi:hypothetical protein
MNTQLIKSYIPTWIREIVAGTINIIKWLPVIYKDRNYDYTYTYKVLKHKLKQQRDYLVHNDRNSDIHTINRDITICLNLIQRIEDEYYYTEHQDYYRSTTKFVPVSNRPNTYEYKEEIQYENFSGYFTKYPLVVKRMVQKYPNEDFNNSKLKLGLYIAYNNHKRAQRLLFKILGERIDHWWD